MSDASTAITYGEFAAWYQQWRPLVLEPGLDEAIQRLELLLQESLAERDRMRIHRVDGRVKSRQRAWRKLRINAAEEPITDLAKVPATVPDLIGVRITCTNLRDIEMLQEVLETLPTKTSQTGLSIDRAAERDYVVEPKESGYRGWHVGLKLLIDAPHASTSPAADGEMLAIGCELQVRTLLQDTWGELTHVDAYSKDGGLPPLVAVLGSRMADLLATLDDIAEDLRTELDRVDDEAAALDVGPTDASALAADTDEQAQEATALLVDRWLALEQPIDLATLAWEMRQQFGPEVSDAWFGHGSFKRFVLEAVPNAEISGGRQQFVLPQEAPSPRDEPASGDETDEDALDDVDTPASEPATGPRAAPTSDDRDETDIPPAARRLREIDKGLPLLTAPRWGLLFDHLAATLGRWDDTVPPARAINRVTRSARDRSRGAGDQLPRRYFDYVLKAVLAADSAEDADPARTVSAEKMSAEKLRSEFTTVTLDRMSELRVLGERNRRGRRAVREWLGS